MSIVDELSSSRGDRTQKSNLAVAEKVRRDLSFLGEIQKGFGGPNIKVAGDAVEIFTMIAEDHPEAVARYAGALEPLLDSKDKRVRWEATHTLVFVARHAAEFLKRVRRRLEELVRHDDSMIVRGYALQALGEYAATSRAAAKAVSPFLMEALELWEGEHVHLALEALGKAAVADDSLAAEVGEIARGYENHEKARVKKAARTALKSLKKR
jgi:hypothetical protein